MKKKLILLCVLALLIAGLAVSAHAEGTISISVGEASATSGGEVEVPISIANNPGAANITFALKYDTSVLTYKSRTWGPAADAFDSKQVTENGATFDGDGSNAANGLLVTLVFDVAQGAGVSEEGTTVAVEATPVDYAVTIEPTASSGGQICNDYDGEKIDHAITAGKVTVTHVHSTAPETWTAGTAATCTTAGDEHYPCTYCNKEVTRDVNALGHNMTKTDGTPVTCTENGVKDTWACDRCNLTFIDENGDTVATEENKVITTEGHKTTKVEAKSATCTEEGNIEHWECTVCLQLFGEEAATSTPEKVSVDALGHDLAAYRADEVKAATCTEDGLKESWKCQRTGCELIFLENDPDADPDTAVEESTLTIDATGHSVSEDTHHDAVDAKFQVTGNKEYWTCSKCYSEDKITTGEDGTVDTNVYFLAKADTDPAEADIDNPVTWADVEIPAITKVTGDINSDGFINGTDATFLRRFNAGDQAEAVQKWFVEGSAGRVNADINDDGYINGTDATFLRRFNAGDQAEAVQKWFANNPTPAA